MSTDPAPGATAVALDAAVSVHFTTALADDSPLPTLSPDRARHLGPERTRHLGLRGHRHPSPRDLR